MQWFFYAILPAMIAGIGIIVGESSRAYLMRQTSKHGRAGDQSLSDAPQTNVPPHGVIVIAVNWFLVITTVISITLIGIFIFIFPRTYAATSAWPLAAATFVGLLSI